MPRAHKALAVVFTALVGGAMAAGPASAAGSATSDFTVTASVADNCTISTTAIAFGAYDPVVTNLTAPKDGTGSVTITCTQGAVATIGLSAGLNGADAVGTTRAMKSGIDQLNYEIYKATDHSAVWGNSGTALLSPVAAPSTAPRTYTTFGRIPGAQITVPAGATYTDTVTATVNF
jgi:spore coat protein U-like protein